MSKDVLENLAMVTENVEIIARSAGKIIFSYFGKPNTKSRIKKDGSLVTNADEEAEGYIVDELKKRYPGISIVGEEACSAGKTPDLKGVETFWLVDALDGTCAFMNGDENFTVNIALVHRYKPVLGVIYAPAKDEMYCGYLAGKRRAYIRHDKNKYPVDIKTREIPEEGMTVMTSGNLSEKDLCIRFMRQYEDKIARTIHRYSSIKICDVASGAADLYLRIGPTKWWDIAAGHAIICAAGGDIYDMTGYPILYGKRNRENLYNTSFFVASGDVFFQTKLLRELMDSNPLPLPLPS